MRNICRTLTISLCAALLGVGTLTFADADARSISYDLNIPSEDLTAALQSFAIASHHKLLYKAELTTGKISKALKGHFTAQEAMEALLSGTGLSYEITGSSVVLIKNQADAKTSAVRQDGVSPSSSAVPQVGSGQPILLAQGNLADGPTTADNQSVPRKDKEQSKSEGEKKDDLEEIIVTGTHIHGVTNIGAPTISITRDQIDQSGYSTIQQVVSTLPQNFSGLTPLGANAAGASPIANQNGNEATSIDLRGLGPQSTLTLVDGKRVAGNIQGRVVDVSLIPLAMVDRVDIVTGGSSAIYGADAVGGVANIVLRHSYEGAETSALYSDGRYGGGRLEFDQVAGHQFSWGGFIVGYEFSRDSSLDLVKTGLVQPISDTGGATLSFREPAASWQHSVNFGGQINPTDRIEIYADASYSHRKLESSAYTSYPSFDFDQQTFTSSAATQYGATLGSRFKWAKDWAFDLSSSWSVFEYPSDTLTLQGAPGELLPTDQPRNERSMLYSFSGVADGTLVSIHGLDIKSAVGAEFRRENFSSNGFGLPSSPSRSVTSAFGELHVPLASTPDNKYSGYYNVEVSAAGRFDHYSDFGHTFNPQFGLVWSPIVDLSIRGTYARAFRAPELYVLGQSAGSALEPVPVITPSNPAGTNFPTLGLGGSNPAIGPERARTWTTGLDYKLPWESSTTTISASYFNIDYRDRINLPIQGFPLNPALYPASVLNLHPTTSQIVTYLSEAPFVGNYLPGSTWDQNPQTLLSQVPGVIVLDGRYRNIASEAVRGLDFLASTQVNTRFGRGDFSVNATRTFSHHYNITPESPEISVVNQVGAPSGTKLRGSAGWTRGGLSGFVFVNYIGSYTNQFTSPASSISSWTTFDLTVMLDTSHYAPQGPWSNIKVSFAAQNVLNRDPPRFEESPLGFLFDSANASPFGRTLSLRATKKW
jgi:iron complex outermembrane receptor protein